MEKLRVNKSLENCYYLIISFSGSKKAAHDINAHNADLVIVGGDLITEGFESSAARSAPRWDAYMLMHRGIKAGYNLYLRRCNLRKVVARPLVWRRRRF